MLRSNRLLYFGIATVAIEWLGLLLGIILANGLNIDQPISAYSTADQPLPLIYGITLTLAAITYFLFTVPLVPYAKHVALTAGVAGTAWILTAWSPYKTGGLDSGFHTFFSFVAAFAYLLVVWQLRTHPFKKIGDASVFFSALILIGMIGTILTVFINHRFSALAQLIVLIAIQTWTIYTVWHTKKYHKLIESK